jgi:hypothetical protein
VKKTVETFFYKRYQVIKFFKLIKGKRNMASLKKFIALATCVVFLGSSLCGANALHAQEYAYTGGTGYIEYRTAPRVTPMVALTAVAIAAIVIVALQNANEHGHDHD